MTTNGHGNISPFERIFDDGVLIDLTCTFWQGRLSNTLEDLGLTAEDVPPFIVGLGTKRLIAKEFTDGWAAIIARARYALRRHSFLFPVGDAAFVPAAALAPVDQELTTLRSELLTTGPDYLRRHYTTIKRAFLEKEVPAEHRDRIAALYPPLDAVTNKFLLTWTAFTVQIPKRATLARANVKEAAAKAEAATKRKLDEDAAVTRYQRELESRMNQFLTASVNTLRARTVELFQTVTEKIGKGEAVTDRSLQTLRRQIEQFKMLNFVGDDVEQKLDALTKEVLRDRTAQDFTDEQARATLDRALTGIIKAAAQVRDVSAVAGNYKRRVDVR